MEERGKLILIVDDDPSFVEATSRVLEGCGYRTTAALSPGECYERLESELPDLIILDVMMARLNSGFDVCRKLKKDVKTKHIPILMLTAIDKTYPFDFGSEAGDEDWLPVDDYVDKPVEAPVLLSHIQRLLGKGPAHPRSKTE